MTEIRVRVSEGSSYRESTVLAKHCGYADPNEMVRVRVVIG